MVQTITNKRKRPKYDKRKTFKGIDLNGFFKEYLEEIEKSGFSLNLLSMQIGLNHTTLYRLKLGLFDDNLRIEHIYKLGILTGVYFDFLRYTYLMVSKDDLINHLEGVESTKKRKKRKSSKINLFDN